MDYRLTVFVDILNDMVIEALFILTKDQRYPK